MKFRNSILLLAILGIAVLSGCSSSNSDSESDSATDSDTNTEMDSDSDSDSNADVEAGLPLWFVKQLESDSRDVATASISEGTIKVHHYYSGSSNVFKADAAKGFNYANQNANFLAYPQKFGGDFSVSATITVDAQNKEGNASGIGVGMFTGFEPGDHYGYMLMRNGNNAAQLYYTKDVTSVGSSSTGTVSYTAGDTMTITLRRVGDQVYYSANLVGTTTNPEAQAGVSNIYGCENDVYVGIAFGNVDATIVNFVVADGTGRTLFDSATGTMAPLTPSSIVLSDSAVDLPLDGGALEVVASASAQGGDVSSVSISGYDAAIVTAAVTNGDAGSTILITPVGAGTTTITVTNDADPLKTVDLLVTISDFAQSDPYSAFTSYPEVGATSAYTDGELSITFDSPPVLNPGGTIRIFTADGTQVDTIGFTAEFQSSWGSTIMVDDQLARVEGNTVFFTPHFDVLAYDKTYYIAIPTTAITGALAGQPFNGFSNDPAVSTWNFTTRAAPVLDATNITVDGSQNGTADFRTVQGALSYLATGLATDTDVTINVAAGTYTELVYYKGGKNVTISGPSNIRGDTCVVQYKNSSGMNSSTHTRASFYFSASNLVLRNITLKNTWKRISGADNQAETLFFANAKNPIKTLAAYNCSFISNQDTLQTTGKNWFYDCFIEGNTDYIWGSAQVALFENCDLHCINDGVSEKSHMFVARTVMTNGAIGKGYVLFNSTVSVDSGLTADFGRNAGGADFYDQIALVNVAFSGAGSLLSTLWSESSNYYYEGDGSYIGWKATGCTGLGADTNTTLLNTSGTIADAATEYDSREHILNRNVTWDGASAFGYADDAISLWDISMLEEDFGL